MDKRDEADSLSLLREIERKLDLALTRRGKERGLDPNSIFTPIPVAARYLGSSYGALIQARCDTLCLNEHRRRQGGRIFLLTAQVIHHAARVAVYKKCDDGCIATGARVIAESRELLEGYQAKIVEARATKRRRKE
jgi:hypothetical protein